MAEAFSSPDPIEELLGKSIIDMTEWEWVSYLKESMQAIHGIRLAADGQSERSIFRCMMKTYGREYTGLILKWSIWRYHGKPDGQFIQFTSFAKGRKWWTDMLYAELQDQLAKEERAAAGAQPASQMVSALKFI